MPRQAERGCKARRGGSTGNEGCSPQGHTPRPLTTPGRPRHPERPAQSFVLRGPAKLDALQGAGCSGEGGRPGPGLTAPA